MAAERPHTWKRHASFREMLSVQCRTWWWTVVTRTPWDKKRNLNKNKQNPGWTDEGLAL